MSEVVHKRILFDRKVEGDGVSTTYISKCNKKIALQPLEHFWKKVTCPFCLHDRHKPNKLSRAMYRLKKDLKDKKP